MTSTLFQISDVSPASASTAVGDVVAGLGQFDAFTVDAALVGATGGSLDVYLQRSISADDSVWADWLHFPQLASGASAIKYHCATSGEPVNTITVVGQGSIAVPAPALAANVFLGGHPGNKVRAVYVAGASTSAGAAVAITIRGIRGLR